MSDDQELLPTEQHTEEGEPLTQSGLEANEATDQHALVPTAVRQVNFHGDEITVVLGVVKK